MRKRKKISERQRERERESEKSTKKILHGGAMAYTRKKQSRAQILSVCERERKRERKRERGREGKSEKKEGRGREYSFGPSFIL